MNQTFSKLKSCLLLFAVLMGFSATSLAQDTVTIGNGTASSTTYGPIYRSSATSSFDYSRNSYLFTNTDLGIPAGATITGVAWDKASTSSIATSADTTASFKVYIENNSSTALSSTAWSAIVASSSLVADTTFDSTNNFAGSGWKYFDFSSPVVYNGNSLQVSVDWDCSLITGSPTTGSFTWRYTGGNTGKTIYGNSGSPITTVNSTSANRPNIRFIYTLPNVNDIQVSALVGPASSCSLGSNETIQAIVSNLGTPSQTNFTVSLTINGGTVISTTYTDTLLGGDTDTITMTTTADLSATGIYSLVGYTTLTGDVNVTNDTALLSINSIPTITTYPFTESWEAGAANWASGGSDNSWELGLPADDVIDTASNGVNAWMTNLDGDYNANEESYVESPCFNIASLTNPEVSMDVWWEAENSWDGANLKYSDDGGATWNLVGSQGSGVNWYNDGTISGLNGAGGTTQVGWTGRNNSSNGSNGWLNAKNDFDTTGVDSIIIFRVYFGADGSGQDDGFAFDAFSFGDKPALDGAVTSIFNASSGCGADSVGFNLVIQNFGTSDLIGIPIHTSLNGAAFSLNTTYNDTLSPGEIDTISVTELSILGTNSFQATTVVAGEQVASNDTSSTTYFASPIISSYPYTQSWEAGAADWFSGGLSNSWELGLPSDDVIDTAFNGVNAWMTNLDGDYNANEESYVQSPCFNISSLSSPEVNMAVWWEAENSWDGANLKYSDDGGATWNLIGSQGTGVNWYNDGSISGLNGAGGTTQVGWTGRNNTSNGSNGWLNAKNGFDTAGVDSIIIFRVYFGADGSGQDDGFAFDSFNLDNTPPFNAGVSAIIGAGNACVAADTIQVVIENFGSIGISNFDVFTSLNGATAVATTYNNTLAVGATDTISVPVSYALGANSFTAYTALSGDIDLSNDTLSSSSYYGDTPVLLTVNTVSFGAEVYWFLNDQNGDLIASVDPGSYVNSTTYYQEVCLVSTDTFTMSAWDDYGDGWNGGTYSYTICDTNGVLADNAGGSPDNGVNGFGTAELEDSESFYIPTAFTYSSIIDSNVSCFGGMNGAATVSGSGGITPYSILWSNGSTDLANDSLMAGTFTYEVSDSTGCFFVDSLTITEPADLVRTMSSDSTLCFGSSDGAASVEVISGGVAPYSYMWSDAAMTANDTVTGLDGGIAYVSITDDNGCVFIDSVTIESPDAISSTVSSVDVVCPESVDGTAVITIDSGGIAPYTFMWSDANMTMNDSVSNLSVGAFYVTTTDDNGCEHVDTVTISALNASPTVSISGKDTICGSETTTLDAGAGFNSYAWGSGATTQTITVNTTGTYMVTITDANGCANDDSYDIFAYGTITLSTSKIDVTCEGGNDGVATGTATGGATGFTYEWNDGSTNSSNIGVEEGTYVVTATDIAGCFAIDTVEVGFLFSNPVFTFAQSNIGGEQSVTVNAGGAFDEYNWSNGANTASVTFTNSGTYSLTVSDTNGCSTTDTITVEIWPLGVNQVEATSMSVYPNPSTGLFNLSLNNVPADQIEIMVMNLNGQVITTTTANASNGVVNDVVDLSNQAAGIYLLQVNINGNVSTLRLNVQ